MDSRRLAIAALAAALGSGGWAAHESDQRAFPMEALRQSSPQRGARSADLAVPADLGALAASELLDPGHYRDRADSGRILLLAGPSAKTHGSAVGAAPGLEPALRLHAPLAGRL